MHKRDYALGVTHGIIPANNVRYETVCLYLETLTRMEVQEVPLSKKDGKAQVTFNPPRCTFCSQVYTAYANVENAASAAWNHVAGCAEENLHIKGDGPLFIEHRRLHLEAVAIIEARMTKYGGLDFETNLEWLFTHLVGTAVHTRVDFFNSLLEDHSLADKKVDEELFGVNIPLLRLIANGQIFNQSFMHPTDTLTEANEESEKCQQLLTQSSGCLPMGSFCGAHGYGFIHPNTINAAVIQRSFASTSSEQPPHWPTQAYPEPTEVPQQQRAVFDMMSIAPNFDLLLEIEVAEEVAKAIVAYGHGAVITYECNPVRPPGRRLRGGDATPEKMSKEIQQMLTSPRFGSWMSTAELGSKDDSDQRARSRMDLACLERSDENVLAEPMSRMIPHMGAHIRAYHFLCFQTQLGHRSNDPITMTEIEEVIPMVIQQGWNKPEKPDDYEKYLSGGNLHLITNDFRGKGRLKALWDITSYALQRGTWSNPQTTEMYLQQMAAFWSLKAPKELPTLPGIGSVGLRIKRFDTPTILRNSKCIESLQVKRITLDLDEKEPIEPPKIVPKAVSKAPVITQQPWDPILGDSEHAYAWWTLTPEGRPLGSSMNKRKRRQKSDPQHR